MLVEAANERGKRFVFKLIQIKILEVLRPILLLVRILLHIEGNKKLIEVSERIIFENEWVHIDRLKLTGFDDFFIPALTSIEPLVDRISQKKFLTKLTCLLQNG